MMKQRDGSANSTRTRSQKITLGSPLAEVAAQEDRMWIKVGIKATKTGYGCWIVGLRKQVSSKVDMRLELDKANWLPGYAKQKLLESPAPLRVTKHRELVVTSDLTRSQAKNIQDCYEKLVQAIKQAAAVPREPDQETLDRIKSLQVATFMHQSACWEQGAYKDIIKTGRKRRMRSGRKLRKDIRIKKAVDDPKDSIIE